MTETVRFPDGPLGGRYRIERELGRGGMAVVLLAHDLKHDRKVAIKVLRPAIAAAVGAERFLREITIAAQLHHPHILPMYDSGEADGLLYFVMPYVEGESLRDRLEREVQLPLAEALQIAREVADAIGYAHSHEVVHRDIKPENILLESGHAIVADFGIARAITAAGGDRLTETGLVIGTAAYMSPEQATGERTLDGRSDVYSLGCVLYEMLAGEIPYPGPTAQAMLARRLTDPVPPLRSRRPSVPPAVERAVAKALARLPADRFSTAQEFSAALERDDAGAVASDGRIPRRSRILLGAGLVALAVAAALLLRSRSLTEPSASVIAVLPFSPTTADTALERLGRDLAATISANLDGVGDIRTVDRLTVLAQVAAGAGPLSLPEGVALGRRLGARSVVYGSLVRAGDNVRLDATLYATDSARAAAQTSVVAAPGDIGALTDSTTYGLLRAIWRRGTAPTPSLEAALNTHSLEALRALLAGEGALVENRWDEAAADFRRAIDADSTFWLAYGRYAFAKYWTLHEAEPQVWSLLERHAAELPERDRRFVEILRLVDDSLDRALAEGRSLTEQYPDYWIGWMVHADQLLHVGPMVGHEREEARVALEQTLRLNSRLIPAWSHLTLLALQDRDSVAVDRCLAALTGLNAGPALMAEGYGDQMLHFRLLRRQLRPDTAGTGSLIDSVAHDVARNRNTGSSFYDPFRYGYFEIQTLLSGKVLRLGPTPREEAAHRELIVLSWMGRGAFDSALASIDRYAEGAGEPSWALEAYRVAVLGSWLGALSPVEADQRREGAARGAPGAGAELVAEIAWIDGVRAMARRDAAGLSAARQTVRASGAPSAAVLERSLAGMNLGVEGRPLAAGTALANLEWQLAQSGNLAVAKHPYVSTIDRLAAARWLAAGGDTATAARLLVSSEASYFISSGTNVNLAVAGLELLERARIEAARGERDAAVRHYQEFLRRYDRPTPLHRHLVEEAVTALRRLSGQTDR